MPNPHVQAAAEGLPTSEQSRRSSPLITRRAALAGLVALPTTGAAGLAFAAPAAETAAQRVEGLWHAFCKAVEGILPPCDRIQIIGSHKIGDGAPTLHIHAVGLVRTEFGGPIKTGLHGHVEHTICDVRLYGRNDWRETRL